MPTKTVPHGQTFCSISSQPILKRSRIVGAKCPHCDVLLPVKGRHLLVTIDDDGTIVSSELAPKPPIWKRTPVIVSAVLVVVFVGMMVMNVAEDGFSSGSDSPSSNSANTVTPTSGFTIVSGELLGDGNYTGSGDYTIIKALKSYSPTQDATAVAAMVSVPGADDLCLFWYVGGRNVGDGLTIGDNMTRAFSVWGADVTVGSPADDWVRALKVTPEGKAVIAGSGC